MDRPTTNIYTHTYSIQPRRDILAPEVCDILEPIQWQTRPHSWAETVESLRTLREDWERILSIDADSQAMLGSGSVAQVYRGRAYVDGAGDPTAPPLPKDVAVKVIHPDVKRQIELDLELMRLGGKSVCVVDGGDGGLGGAGVE